MAKLTEEQKMAKAEAKRLAQEAKALAKLVQNVEKARVKVQQEVAKLSLENIEKGITKEMDEIQILDKLEMAINGLIEAFHQEADARS